MHRIYGFNRRIIWLRYLKSNNDPNLVGRLYVNEVQDNSKIPCMIRKDCGSENVFIAAAQTFFRRNTSGRAHIYGSSHHNQCIEAWWAQFRRMRSDHMINIFREMVNNGEYNEADKLQKHCIRFCFGKLIGNLLDKCREEWNSHYIRKSESSECYGCPDVNYFFPPDGFSDQAISINSGDVQAVNQEDSLNDDSEENIYDDYFQYLSERLNIQEPDSLIDARRNYLMMIQHSELVKVKILQGLKQVSKCSE